MLTQALSELNPGPVGEEIITKASNNKETGGMKEAIEGVELVPSEGYVEENKDGVKSFRCKQCDKPVKTEKGVKTHIAHVHKDQALKRIAANETNSDEVHKRKKDIVEDFEFSDESLKMDLLCDQVLSSSPLKE